MRTIKFRGKRLDNGEWEYGYYAVHHISLTDIDHKTNQIIRVGTRTSHAIFNDERKDESGYWKDIAPETVGQFTGLHDKDGKEIYEGDVIQDDDKNEVIRHLIRYDDRKAGFVATLIGKSMNTPFETSCEIYQRWISEYGKTVIDNIHDTPELLKGCKR